MIKQTKMLFIIELDTGLLIEHVVDMYAKEFQKIQLTNEISSLLDLYMRDGVLVSGPGAGNITQYSPRYIRSITTQRLQ